ncbi:IS110 family transposase [Natronosporangium hydrolyticum]|uniref:IS110 family transposase n=1 Tax=Natronosporangium hydrolyticum TaxID=2811111 RepID=A0A895YLV2_9ACTN|nr:transposase [Natronosporangium hydrolyticum]QSB16952.1 IS110 family transposase [Natronosporangium hydrolyticum]
MIDEQVRQLGERIDVELEPYQAEVALLDSIPGVDIRAAQVILAEIGPDMTRFPSAGHLASWAGLCPGNNKTGGKARSGRTRPGDKWLRAALGTAARSVSRSRHGYLAAQWRRIAARRGGNRATVAVAHSMITAVWHMLTHNVTYHDLGSDHFLQLHNPDRRRKRLVAGLELMGYQVELTPRTQPGTT